MRRGGNGKPRGAGGSDRKAPENDHSVSYTHLLLDLVHGCEAEDRFGYEEVAWLLLFGTLPTQAQLTAFTQPLAPVSYTHLDVYKRQPLHWGVLQKSLPQRREAPPLSQSASRSACSHRRALCQPGPAEQQSLGIFALKFTPILNNRRLPPASKGSA